MNKTKIKIICCGLGKGFEDFLCHLDEERVEIVGVVDKHIRECQYTVLNYEQLKEIAFDFAVICSRNYLRDIAQFLLQYIEEDKIIAAPNCIKLDSLYQRDELMQKMMKPSYVEGKLVWGKRLPFKCNQDHSDYIRKSTFALVAQMIQKRKVKGECAEVGVFRGAFAKLINESFPDRKLYLFDTFEGFDERDLANTQKFNLEIPCCLNLFNGVLDTSVQYVLNNMPIVEQCIIRKG